MLTDKQTAFYNPEVRGGIECAPALPPRRTITLVSLRLEGLLRFTVQRSGPEGDYRLGAAGILRVDEAEIEVERCFRENMLGPGILAAARPKYTVSGSERGVLLPTLEHALRRFFDGKKASIRMKSII
jgi:hypothetical protein